MLKSSLVNLAFEFQYPEDIPDTETVADIANMTAIAADDHRLQNAGYAKLAIDAGETSYSQIVKKYVVTIGRRNKSVPLDVALDVMSVSRQHATISYNFTKSESHPLPLNPATNHSHRNYTNHIDVSLQSVSSSPSKAKMA